MSGFAEQRAQVENSGLVIFVYDEANAERIRAAGPEILDGFSDEMAAEESLLDLARDGALVVYELQQDDSRDVVVRVEREGGDGAGYLPERRVRLSLPSGRLCVEGYDCLRISDEWRFQAEQHHAKHGTEYEYTGAVFDVPPGEYVLGIRQIDVSSDEAEDESLPTDILTLRPAEPGGAAEAAEGILLIR